METNTNDEDLGQLYMDNMDEVSSRGGNMDWNDAHDSNNNKNLFSNNEEVQNSRNSKPKPRGSNNFNDNSKSIQIFTSEVFFGTH